MVDFVRNWSAKTGLSIATFVDWLGISRSKFYQWSERYGSLNAHNGKIPRDHWLTPDEQHAIIDFADKNPEEGYRRLTYMMIDHNVAAVSATAVYRILKHAGRLGRWNKRSRSKGKGFEQPTQPHQHWHIDVSYINVSGTFYYLCSLLDGYTRSIISWRLGEQMRQADIEIVIQRGHELYPNTKPRIISDNGPQFIARDFKQLIRVLGMSHVRTSPNYPQSNGKLERWHGSLKSEAIRPQMPLSLEDAKRIVKDYIHRYNHVRLHSALGYITPQAMLEGQREQIHAERDQKLEAARQLRAQRRRHLTLSTHAQSTSTQLEKRTRALEESNPPGIPSCGGQPATGEPNRSPTTTQVEAANA